MAAWISFDLGPGTAVLTKGASGSPSKGGVGVLGLLERVRTDSERERKEKIESVVLTVIPMFNREGERCES